MVTIEMGTYKNMDKLRGLIDIGFRDPMQGFLAGLFVPGSDTITNHNAHYGFATFVQQNHSSICKT